MTTLALEQDENRVRNSFNVESFQRLNQGFEALLEKRVLPEIKVGKKLPKMSAAMDASGDDLDAKQQPSYGKRFGKELITNGAKVVGIMAVASMVVPIAAAAAPTVVAVAGFAFMAMGVKSFASTCNKIRKNGGIRKNPELAAQALVRGVMIGFGAVSVGVALGGDGFIGSPAAADVPAPPPAVEPITIADVAPQVEEAIAGDNIETPAEVALADAAQTLSQAAADPSSVTPVEAVEAAALTADALHNGTLGGSPVGAEMVEADTVNAQTVVAEPQPELAEQVQEAAVRTYFDTGEVSANNENMADMLVDTADVLANNGQFGDDVVAAERLEAVVEAEGPLAEVALTHLEALQANIDAGTTEYTIQSGDNLTHIVEGNDVYSSILENMDSSEQGEALQAIMERIMELNPSITNPNQIYVGQEIVMPDLSGVDTATLEASHNWAEYNSDAGMSHHNSPKP